MLGPATAAIATGELAPLKATMPPENMAPSKLITPSEIAGRRIRRTWYEILVCMDPLAPLRTVGAGLPHRRRRWPRPSPSV